ncbi:MAG: esterase/lipase family protein [Sporichthyaceae bacterium]
MRRFSTLTCAVAIALGASGFSPAAGAAPGPALRASSAQVAEALHCPTTLVGKRDPVLFVGGITQRGGEAWSWNYGAALPGRGHDVCWIDLPEFSTADNQLGGEYVVGAIRTLAKRTGRAVDVVTLSQGAVNVRWALAWWPDVPSLVDDAVLLAGTNHGTNLADVLCTPRCVGAFWQLRPGSNFIAALNSVDPTPGSVDVTNVYSTTDNEVYLVGGSPDPWTAAVALDGAANIRIQDVCPGRFVEHVQHSYDAAVFSLVLDALEHDGPADPRRVGSAACLEFAMPGVDPAKGPVETLGAFARFADRANRAQTTAEPALEAYAR